MYQYLLKYCSIGEIKTSGIVTNLKYQNNKLEIPKIYASLGGIQKGQLIFVQTINENNNMNIYKQLLFEVGINSAIKKYGNKLHPEAIRLIGRI
jgi:hypothetical protein